MCFSMKSEFLILILCCIFFQMAEETMEDEQKKIGMTKDGSLVVDEENDYAIQFLKNIDWNRPLKKTTSSIPFISKEEFSNTMAMKYMNYECEALYVDDTDPMIGENIKDLRGNISCSFDFMGIFLPLIFIYVLISRFFFWSQWRSSRP